MIQKKQLTALIIDDEEKSRTILKQMILEYVPFVQVLALATDVLEGVKAVHDYKPDIVFLDIEMPDYSGFKLLEQFDEIDFEIVFTTAYEKYAVKAYKTNAIGYLMKPIDIDELILISKKILNKAVGQDSIYPVEQNSNKDTSNRFIFPTKNGLIYLSNEEICYLESQGRYSEIALVNGDQMLTTLGLKDCMEKLKKGTFIRVHRSYIINLSHIKNYSRGRDRYVVLDNGKRVDVGQMYKDDLNEAISHFLK